MGKGLAGGIIAVYPDRAATFPAGENIIVGNVCMYGATKVRSCWLSVHELTASTMINCCLMHDFSRQMCCAAKDMFSCDYSITAI